MAFDSNPGACAPHGARSARKERTMNVRTAPSAPPVAGHETEALAHALHGDPFRVLGPHETAAGTAVRAFLPGAESAEVLRRADRARIGRLEHFDNGLFQGIVSDRAPY